VNLRHWGDFYLHSKSDIHPRRPIIRNARGVCRLHYEICSFGFPRLEFVLKLHATDNPDTAKLTLD